MWPKHAMGLALPVLRMPKPVMEAIVAWRVARAKWANVLSQKEAVVRVARAQAPVAVAMRREAGELMPQTPPAEPRMAGPMPMAVAVAGWWASRQCLRPSIGTFGCCWVRLCSCAGAVAFRFKVWSKSGAATDLVASLSFA